MTIEAGTKMIQNARQKQYAIGAFNTNNLEWTQAILRTAQAEQAPTLVAVSMGAVKYMGGFKVVANLIRNLHDAMSITVPIAIHLDHGTFEGAKAAIEAGFTSVMFDGSDLPVEENLTKTREIVALAHEKGVSVEAEVGSIGGEEDGVIGAGEIAPIEDVRAMVATGIDFLAAGIGNIHGAYPDNWQGLNLEHLKDIAVAANEVAGHEMPIVLHGGSGIPDDHINAAIKLGVAKVNVNTEAQLAFHQAIRDYVLSDQDLIGKNYDPRKFLAPGVAAIESALDERIKVFGSGHQA
ncbi:class II fructose-1,6-bisphosphate aldolase [Weissella diestrammenae]|uniref:Class II fructose-1,6-bisphosphate aldolase n=1 Tax=Weissella diestrammenae TaxID=1162633 RepID=A0A7G9T5I7_9LACO|nr:class II fructose-1,6-bisphosphate aldolase [Weissella diestrammenae]MCM0582186.1 class II fructose-1,6-bisphosphate aldolase [Weissella diestrammenae]QNN75362.1 class II fructose-1,6-bisphosphate aldolase [Weissella diestrammenae]